MKKTIALIFLLLSVSAQGAFAAEAQAVVEDLHASLLEAMRGAKELGYAGRVELLKPKIDSSFDFNTIARIVTGRAWKNTSEAQRATFFEVFRTLSTVTYATNFSDYNGEKFVTSGSEKKRSSVIVRSHLVKADGEQIPLNYMLREDNGNWLIVNVIAKGVSDISLKRAEYTAVIKSEGFDSLVKRLQEKVKEINLAR